jgi:VanZ family protein
VICVLCAMLDEFHQLFVPGRGAQVKDVIIDTVGAIVGIGVCGIWGKLIKR